MNKFLSLALLSLSTAAFSAAQADAPKTDVKQDVAPKGDVKKTEKVKLVKAKKTHASKKPVKADKAESKVDAKADAKADASKTEAATQHSSGSQAQAPTLKINGFSAIQWAGASQKNRSNGKGGQASQIGIGASDLYFTATGVSAGGITYKYRANIAMISNKTPIIDRNYIEFGGEFGTFQIGSLTGPEDTMPQSALNLLGGANTIDGVLGSIYNMSGGVISGVNILGETKRSNKVVYTTPQVMGFQVGVAYTPNTSLRGNSGANSANPNSSSANAALAAGSDTAIYPTKANAAFGLRNIALGLTYKNTWEDLSLALAAVMVTERSRLVLGATEATYAVNNLRSFNYSATLGYGSYRFALGLIDNGKSRLPKQAMPSAANLGNIHEGNSGKAWNTGLQYTSGAYQFAVGYYNTKRKTDASSSASSDIFSATADFSALQGLKFFGEVDFINSRTNDAQLAVQRSNGTSGNTIGNNRGQVVAVGTKVSF